MRNGILKLYAAKCAVLIDAVDPHPALRANNCSARDDDTGLGRATGRQHRLHDAADSQRTRDGTADNGKDTGGLQIRIGAHGGADNMRGHTDIAIGDRDRGPCGWLSILEIEPDFLDAGDDHDHDHHHHGHDHHHHDHGHSHGGLKHYHDEEMQSLSLRTDKPLDPTKFMPWLQQLVASEGQKILRSKGILAFSDDDDRYVFQGVHMMLEGDHQRKWKEGERRESRVVFIGRELPEQMIRDGFERCIVT